MGLNEKFFKSAADSPNFNIVTYTGTGNSTPKTVTGVGFQPDLVWGKSTSNNHPHIWFDSVRGENKQLSSNDTAAEVVRNSAAYEFESDGFKVTTAGNLNNNFQYVAWCWKAGGAASTNTNGSRNSEVSVNQDAGFSIVSYTGNATNSTIGHGLGILPKLIIYKNRNANTQWDVYAASVGADKRLQLSTTGAESTTSTPFNNTNPTTSVFSLGIDLHTNGNNNNIIAYCFADVLGYQKIGSYVGGGSSSNPTVTCGFEPRFLMVKKATGTVSNSTGWTMVDNVRHPGTPTYVNGNVLYADAPIPAQDDDNLRGFIITSTGFSPNGNYIVTNNENDTYIFLAIA